MSNEIDEIKNRLNIVDVIGSYIKLEKAGQNYRACCPFHSEKSPSFFVSPARQIWHCFGGCNEGGDIFKFVMKIEGVEFGDALRILAGKAGVELQKQSPEYKKLKTERQKLHDVCELSSRFFQKQLESKTGQEAKKYLLERGFNEKSINEWGLGYAPDSWDGLSNFLEKSGYKKEEIINAGMAVKKSNTNELKIFDRFRSRIMFPIFDLNNQIVGFTGRVFQSDDPAKYVNTPNTLIYDKGHILYGLNKAKIEIRKKDVCIMVEGNADTIMVRQAGGENVIATSGVALSDFQLKLLKRYTENLIIAFDVDAAGEDATNKGIDLAQNQGFNIKIVRVPEGKDPADLILKDPKEWENALNNAISILEFYFNSALNKGDKESPEGKKAISKAFLPKVKQIQNKIEQSHWLQKLATEINASEADLREELGKINPPAGGEKNYIEPQKEDVAQTEIQAKTRKDLLNEKLVSLIIKYPEDIDMIEECICLGFTPQVKEVYDSIKSGKKLESDVFSYLSLMAEVDEIKIKDVVSEIELCIKEIKKLNLKDEQNKIYKEIKKAEENNDLNKVEELKEQFNSLINNNFHD